MGIANTKLQTGDLHLPVHSIEAYLHYINQIPMLTAEEEHDLAVRLQKDGDEIPSGSKSQRSFG